VTFTTTVTSGSSPVTTGTVTFRDGSTVLASGVALNSSGQAAFTISSLTAGTHPITAEYSGTASFLGSSASLSQTVNPAALTVTADNASKVYGEANPAFSASYSGFVLGEGPDVLGGTLSISTPATASSPVGSYAITPNGLTSTDYSITFVTGTLDRPRPRCRLPASTSATAGARSSAARSPLSPTPTRSASAASYRATITWGTTAPLPASSAAREAPQRQRSYTIPTRVTTRSACRSATSSGYTTTATANDAATVTSLGLAVQKA
jgi:hypothetical protein